MSQSPDSEKDPSKSYLEGWASMYELIRQGMSWSGHERHCAFLNTGGVRFADISAVAGLDLADDGRGLAVVDWDQDGALDIWATNRTGPRIRFFRNQHKSDHHFLRLRLEGRTSNRDAIGATVTLQPRGESARKFVRVVEAGDAYLAQSSKWLHFGLGTSTEPERVVVRWPGGAVEEFADFEIDRWYRLVEGTGVADPWQPPSREVRLAPTTPKTRAPTRAGRTYLAARLPLHGLFYLTEDGERTAIEGDGEQPLLINLWASWCANCQKELTELSGRARQLRKKTRILALSVDAPEDRVHARKFLDALDWSFESGYAGEDLLELLGIIHQSIVDQPGEMVLPTSLLIDREHRLAAIYRGPVAPDTLLADLETSQRTPENLRDLAVAFPGRWVESAPPSRGLESLSNLLRSRGHTEIATAYLSETDLPDYAPDWAKQRRAETHENLGRALAREGKHAEAVEAYRKGLKTDPNRGSLHRVMGSSLSKLGQTKEATEHYAEAVRLDPDNGGAHFDLGMALVLQRRLDEAESELRLAIERSPPDEEPHYLALYNLGVLYGTKNKPEEAVAYTKRALELQPELFSARRFLGYVYQRQGRIPEAIAEYQRALAVQPRESMTLFYLGSAYVEAGDRKNAALQHALLKELGDPAAEKLQELIERMKP